VRRGHQRGFFGIKGETSWRSAQPGGDLNAVRSRGLDERADEESRRTG